MSEILCENCGHVPHTDELLLYVHEGNPDGPRYAQSAGTKLPDWAVVVQTCPGYHPASDADKEMLGEAQWREYAKQYVAEHGTMSAEDIRKLNAPYKNAILNALADEGVSVRPERPADADGHLCTAYCTSEEGGCPYFEYSPDAGDSVAERATEDAKAFVKTLNFYAPGIQWLTERLAEFAEQYAAKRLESEAPRIRREFVEKVEARVEKLQSDNQDLRDYAAYDLAMEQVLAELEGK